MKFARLLLRTAILSLAAAAFVWLTGIFGDSRQISAPNRGWQAERAHRASTPRVAKFAEFLGAGVIVAVVAAIGRIIFRLRLSPAPRNAGQPILLDLRAGTSPIE